jgi:hypothetical protein
LTKKAPYKGPGADSEEKHEPVGDIDTAAMDSLKVLDPKRPIREADINALRRHVRDGPLATSRSVRTTSATGPGTIRRLPAALGLVTR